MATQYWVGATSGDVSAAANWNNGASISNNDKLIFDSAAQGDVLSGTLAGPRGVAIAIGPGFSRTIGTSGTQIPLQEGKAGGDVAIYMQDGFANILLKTPKCVIAQAPLGDQLFLDGDMDDVSVTSAKGRITFGASTDITNLVVAPVPGEAGDRPEIKIESGGDVDNIYLMGPCHVENSVGASQLIVSHPSAEYIQKDGNLSGTMVVVAGGTVRVETEVFVSDDPVLIHNGKYIVEPSCRLFSFASDTDVQLFSGGVFSTEWVPSESLAGTITSYGGQWDMRKPGTVTIPGDTKLSSTSGRSLNFQLAANSGHVPTVLW